VILLDEVEKAHPDVFNILLQVLDDGQLTDGQGRKVDFKNTVLVMTSNLGSDVIQTMALGSDSEGLEENLEKDYESMRDAVMEIVGSHFRPEFINRIDESVVFHPLIKDQIRGIADIQLQSLSKRLEDRDLTLSLSAAAKTKLVDLGYDPVFGARPLKRAIQQWIENPLAQAILSGEFMPGDEIKADVSGEKFTFNTAPRAD
jgi:ATP-dependent Clp protease ATP-binding subunit ClpB